MYSDSTVNLNESYESPIFHNVTIEENNAIYTLPDFVIEK